MTPTEINCAIAKEIGIIKKPTRFKHRCGEHLSPCPKCGSKDLDLHDCGYSSFNCGGVKCCACKHELKLSNLSCFPTKEIASAWNKSAIGKAPDFYHSLDACAMFRKSLTLVEKEEFARNLSSVVLGYSTSFPTHNLDYMEVFILVNSDAKDQCQAYLRLKNKWLETTK